MKKDRYRIAVLGTGSWGITIADILYSNDKSVTLWEFDPVQAQKVKKTRRFSALKGYNIPGEIHVTDSLSEAVDRADYIVFAVPSKVIDGVAKITAKSNIKNNTVLISTIKGFEHKSLLRPSQVLRKYFGTKRHIAVLSGPSHAEEVIKKIPTATVISSCNKRVNKNLQELFSNVYFRVYTTTDIKGVEIGGALKNVIAIGSGISRGLNLGDNTTAALITRGNAEMTRLGIELGAKRMTFNGLSGIGDLIVTCFSEHSRNFRFGCLIGRGYKFEEATKCIDTTVEGINTVSSCYKLAKKYKVQMPLCNKIYEILFKGKPAAVAWKELMLRPLKSEYLKI